MFKLNASDLASRSIHPANAVSFQTITGFFNVTAAGSFYSFFGKPHFYGVDDNNITQNIIGLNPNNPHYFDWWIKVEPESGITMESSTPGQLSFEVPVSGIFYPSVRSGIYPIFWQDAVQVISDTDASNFKEGVNGLKTGSLSAWIILPFLGIVFIGIAIYLIIRVPTPMVFNNKDDEIGDKVELSVIPKHKEESSKKEKEKEKDKSRGANKEREKEEKEKPKEKETKSESKHKEESKKESKKEESKKEKEELKREESKKDLPSKKALSSSKKESKKELLASTREDSSPKKSATGSTGNDEVKVQTSKDEPKDNARRSSSEESTESSTSSSSGSESSSEWENTY